LFKFEDTYDKANEKLKKAEDTSDLQSEADDQHTRLRQKKFVNAIVICICTLYIYLCI
jgi:hypothetical protein